MGLAKAGHWMTAGLAVAVAAAALPTPARAAEGMPQLDFSNPLTVGQAIWMLIIFLVLYLLVKNWGLPKVATVVEARNASILSDLEAARAAKTAGDAAMAEMEATTRKAHADAQREIADAVSAAKAQAAIRAAELNARLDAKMAEAEAQIGAARTAAMGALREVAGETTQLIMGRLLGTQADRASTDAAVAQVMAARGHA